MGNMADATVHGLIKENDALKKVVIYAVEDYVTSEGYIDNILAEVGICVKDITKPRQPKGAQCPTR